MTNTDNPQTRLPGLQTTKVTGASIGKLAAFLPVSILAVSAIAPVLFLRTLRRMTVKGEVNSYEPKSRPMEKQLSNGTLCIENISYGKNYPNSYLDIYIPNGNMEIQRPVFLFVHGGGYAWGDKIGGDPFGKDIVKENYSNYLLRVVESGYNVVSINYALAPDYRYPEPVHQIDEAVRFLQESGDKYGLDMDNLIFAGGSAGGQLAGQYVNIQTNPEYAKEMGMTASLEKENIKAVIFNSALLDPARFDKTSNPVYNWGFGIMGKIYFNTHDLRRSTEVKQSNVIEHLSPDFPPTFITDGNTASFPDQAEDLDKRMKELGISHMLNLYDRSGAKLGHGYESSLDSRHAEENFAFMLDFLGAYVKGND